MKWRFLVIFCLILAFGCKKNTSSENNTTNNTTETTTTDSETTTDVPTENIPEAFGSEEQTSFKAQFDEFITALREGDAEKMAKFINKDGIHVASSGEGVSNVYFEVKNAEELLSDEPVAILDDLIMASQDGVTLEYEDLSKLDICDYSKTAFTAGGSSTTLISQTYDANQANLGEDVDEELLNKIKALEEGIQVQLWYSVGEEGDALFFSEEDGQWYLSLIDFTGCGN